VISVRLMADNADDKGLRLYYIQGGDEGWHTRASMHWQIKFQVKKKKDLESENGAVRLKHTATGRGYYKLIFHSGRKSVIKTDS